MHLVSIVITGSLADLVADLRITIVIMPKKRLSPWQSAYKQKPRLHVTNRDVKTSTVIKADCPFCKYFGRQVDMANHNRAARVANHTYMPDFHADVMTKHMKSQHQEKWSKYQTLSPSKQLKLFDGIVLRNNTLQ